MINLIGVAGLVVFIYMVIFYLVAQAVKNNSIVDIGWGPGFLILTFSLLLYSGSDNIFSYILLVLVSSWAIRLSLHIYLRNRKKPEDFRYANWRKAWGKKQPWIAFYKIFMLQGAAMVVIALPLISFFGTETEGFEWNRYAGSALFLFGLIFESVGDYQLMIFKKKPENKGKIIRTGLWKFTRHPNYFGEAVVWWGIWLICLDNNIFAYLSILSPLTVTFLLRFGSGVPMLEEKYKNHRDFQEYAKRTPVFVPFIGRKRY